MAIQNITTNLQRRVGNANRVYLGLWRTYRDTQHRAVTVVIKNGRSVTNTEVGAAKNLYTSAHAAYERARADGIRATVRDPVRYMPAGRKQIAAAYRATLDLLGKTRGELSEVVTGGYRQMSKQLSAAPASTSAVAEPNRETSEAVKTATDDAIIGAEQSDQSSTPAKTPRKNSARQTQASTTTTTDS